MEENKSGTDTFVRFDTENSIILGNYLDLLLNRSMDSEEEYEENEAEGVYVRYVNDKPIQATASKLGRYEHILYAKDKERLCRKPENKINFTYSGGIKIPHYLGKEKTDEGSGNIIISGKPGVGKSTLAFQFAAACASGLNEGIAVYFSLDVDEKQIVKSMQYSDKDLKINFLCDYPSAENDALLQYDTGSNEELADMFEKVLYKDRQNRIIPQIVLPKLSPRGISLDTNVGEDTVFLQRIDELHKLIRAISAYNGRQRERNSGLREPVVKLVVIDSLDVFGERTLTREEINRLFMLFKQYGIIGVFTMGSVGYDSLTSEALYKASVTYQADVVIELKREFYNNYTCSYFEIVKSRNIRHVLGHHPYKVENCQAPAGAKTEDGFFFKNTELIKKIVVLPSLHYRISASENSVLVQKLSKKEEKENWKKTIFGISEIVNIMPNHFKKRSMEDFPQIITISGSSGLFKSDLALNALLSGIVDCEGERGLIVRLGDRDAFALRGVRFENELLERTKKLIGNAGDKYICFYEKGDKVIHNDEPNKYTLRGWALKKDEPEPQLLEVTFKNGALLPEEFVDEICKIINIYKIRRVVFTDLKFIGSSYPFLVKSDTSGNLFLSAFVHIMRNYGMHVIMSSSESRLEASDVELRKAEILADAILKCTAKKEKGGYKAVYILGEGLITNQDRKRARFSIKYENQYSLLFCDELGSPKSEVELCPFSIETNFNDIKKEKTPLSDPESPEAVLD